MEPVELTCTALHFAAARIWDEALTALAARQPLSGNFPELELLTNCLAEIERALPMATAVDDPSVAEETLLLKAYFQSFARFADLHHQVTRTAADQPLDRAGVERAVASIRNSLEASAGHLEQQQAALWADPEFRPAAVLAGYRRSVADIVERLTAIPSALAKRKK